MIRLIGLRCKHSNVLSREVLIARFLLGNLEITNERSSVLLNEINHLDNLFLMECFELVAVRIVLRAKRSGSGACSSTGRATR